MRRPLKKYTIDTCKESSSKFFTRKAWREKFPNYNAAIRHGWRNELTEHMSHAHQRWILEACIISAQSINQKLIG